MWCVFDFSPLYAKNKFSQSMYGHKKRKHLPILVAIHGQDQTRRIVFKEDGQSYPLMTQSKVILFVVYAYACVCVPYRASSTQWFVACYATFCFSDFFSPLWNVVTPNLLGQVRKMVMKGHWKGKLQTKSKYKCRHKARGGGNG